MSESESTKRLKRYLKIVQNNSGLEVLILRSHLLIEEELRALIDLNIKYPNNFKHRKFNFSQCLILVSSNYGQEEISWLWEAINLLNQIRNTMAHKIESYQEEKINIKLDQLDLIIGNKSGVPMPDMGQSTSRMQWRLASMYSVLSSLKETHNKALKRDSAKNAAPLS